MEKGNNMPDEMINKYCCDRNRAACEKLMGVRFDSLNSIFESKLAATDKARELAAAVLSERLSKLNELRQMAQDRDVNFVTKAEFNAQVINIEQLRLSEAKLAGKASQTSVIIAYILAVVGLIVSIIDFAVHFMK